MNDSNFNPPPLAELFAELARHRKILLIGYFFLLVAFCLYSTFRGLDAFIDMLAHAFGVTAWSNDLPFETTTEGLVDVGLILGLQIPFLWIWGRLRDERNPTAFPRLLLPYLLTVFFLSLTIFTVWLSCSELVELWGIVIFDGLFDVLAKNNARGFWATGALVVIPLGYFVYRFIRGRSRCRALWRLVQLCFVASLFDLTLALPTEFAVRGHKGPDLLAALTGSIFALVYSLLFFLWTLGLIVYLLGFPAAYEGDPIS
jgi:hypothetical protein